MNNRIYVAEMGNPPSPDEGSTYKPLKDKLIQGKILAALEVAWVNIGKEEFELYHQTWKLQVVVVKSWLTIELIRPLHYTGRGDGLQFSLQGILYIKEMVKKHNDAVKKLQKWTHAALEEISVEIQTA